MDFKEMRRKTLEVLEKLYSSEAKKWSIETRFMDLIEEVGELANAVLVKQGHKPWKRKKSDLGDSFADVLFDLIVLAEEMGIDLEKEYEKMVKSLEERIEKGEFRD